MILLPCSICDEKTRLVRSNTTPHCLHAVGIFLYMSTGLHGFLPRLHRHASGADAGAEVFHFS